MRNMLADFQIEMEHGLGKELEQMCNLSDYVEEIGIEKGREKGRDGGGSGGGAPGD